MKPPPRGRPKRNTGLDKEAICRVALSLLDKSGPDSLSLRGLAGQLGVTPMALYNHFPDRASLLRSMTDLAYRGVATHLPKRNANARARTKHLLTSYYNEVARHPHLTLSIFSTPEAFSEEAVRITEQLKSHLKESKLTPTRRGRWLDILIDFTHGSSIATAMGLSSGALKKSAQQLKAYSKELDELLDCIF